MHYYKSRKIVQVDPGYRNPITMNLYSRVLLYLVLQRAFRWRRKREKKTKKDTSFKEEKEQKKQKRRKFRKTFNILTLSKRNEIITNLKTSITETSRQQWNYHLLLHHCQSLLLILVRFCFFVCFCLSLRMQSHSKIFFCYSILQTTNWPLQHAGLHSEWTNGRW